MKTLHFLGKNYLQKDHYFAPTVPIYKKVFHFAKKKVEHSSFFKVQGCKVILNFYCCKILL